MKRIAIFTILLAGPVLALGKVDQNAVAPLQPNNAPIVPPPTTQVYNGGGGWGYGGGQTPQGAALQGLSHVISASGQAHLANSAAAINYTQAESNELRNEVQGVNTFWAMRDIGRAERAKERGPNPTPEELARRARSGAPSPLNTNQIDPVTGQLHWPAFLTQDMFKDQRTPVDDCAAKWVKYGTLDYTDQTTMRQNIDAMFDALKDQISAMAPPDYVQCRRFLQSLLYATTRSVN
jgi:hypothetical protein